MLNIYVANLGKYNEGELLGKWISLPATNEEMGQLYIDIKVAHRNEKGEFIPYYEENNIIYEEVAIHDYETDFSGLSIEEYEDITYLNEFAEELADLDDDDIKVINAIIEATGDDLEYAIEHKDDSIYYRDMTMEDVAAELVEEGLFGEIPESIRDYIDYEAIARDLEIDSYYKVDGGVIDIR